MGSLDPARQPVKWLGQERALVRFKDDPTLLHCRIVLCCDGGNLVKVVTPDRDINETRLEVWDTYSEVIRLDGGRLPGGIRKNQTYLPEHSPDGEFTPEELLGLTRRAMDEGFTSRPNRRVHGKLVGGVRVPPKPTGKEGDETSDHLWVVVYTSSGKGVGDELAPPTGGETHLVGGREYALFSMGGHDYLCRRMSNLEAETLSKQATPSKKDDSTDLRVLPVLFDAAEERWRTLSEAIPEYEEIEFDDFPLSGPRTVYRDVRQLRRQGMDFIQHHESWLKKSGVRSSDRSVYEHGCLCRALNFMASYDQLNLPSLASAEALNRRRTLIEVAHQGRPDAPSYEGSEEIMGMREAADGSVIDPALTQHAA